MKFSFYKKKSDNEFEISVKVTPKASKTRFGNINKYDESLKVYVTAPPRDCLANKALIEFIKKTFKCRSTIIKGLSSRNKVVLLNNITEENLIRKISDLESLIENFNF